MHDAPLDPGFPKPLPAFPVSSITLRPVRELLKHTTTRCPVCRQPVPGEVWREGVRPAKVFLRRTCPEHGDSSACLASDARFYWLAKGSDANACCGGRTEDATPTVPSQPQCCTADGTASGTLGRNAAGHGDQPFETLSTCLALIEIVHSCNLSCPTCYADSPLGAGGRVDAVPLDDLQRRITGIIDRKGGLEILQLSGGEPTLHPQFFELLAWAQNHPKIDYVLVNTNGVKLAHDETFAGQFATAAARRKVQLYLQFDGVQSAAQHALRGADLRSTRERALDRAAAMDLPVTLAMTVTPDNLAHIWEAIAFGLARPIVHGITFQPLFGSGRLNITPDAPSIRLNTADLLLAAVEQSAGQLKFDDFTPLPCGDPNCATIGYLLRLQGKIHSVSEFLDFAQLQGFLKDKVHYTLEDLARCGCETEPLGALLKTLELRSSVAFRIMVKPFMDAWTWDQDRIDRCCTHVIRPDGQLDSFCRYYSGFPDTAVEA
jgi:7,8-dihydro-6-hydroxymethylpterin dimethyltransferase